MSATAKIQLSPEAQKKWHDIRNFSAPMLLGVARAMKAENQLTIRHIQSKYLSFPKQGPAVPIGLRVQTNRLRASIRDSDPVIEASRVRSGIGTNVKYGAIHEFGFAGDVTVGGHLRKRTSRQVIFGKRRKVRGADIGVRSHTRHVHLPARMPIQRGIADRLPEYSRAISAEILKEWNR